jgi:hypothetical protein
VPEPATPPTPAKLWRITQEVEIDEHEDIAWDDEDEVIPAGAED